MLCQRPRLWILSDDPPRGQVISLLLLIIVVGLITVPWWLPSSRALDTAARIAIFIIVAASFDLLIGFAGITSFGHCIFFGIGGYAVAIALLRVEASWTALLSGAVVGLVVAALMAGLLSLFMLKVRAIFFAMVTLAIGQAAVVIAKQAIPLTGGDDGITFTNPTILTRAFRLDEPFLGITINGRLILYYVILVSAIILFLAMLRLVNSPFGRTLQAIRENEVRAEALGVNVIGYLSLAFCISGCIASIAGMLLALWVQYTNPDAALSLSVMLDILLMVVVGGVGTLYGAIVGAALFIVAQNYTSAGLAVIAEYVSHNVVLARLFDPDRWMLWFGILFICSVLLFPKGIVGTLQRRRSAD